MLARTGGNDHAKPMTVHFDKDYCNTLFIYTQVKSDLAPGGPAMMQVIGKGHKLFACIAGTLSTVTDRAMIDRFWSNQVEAWYDQGKDDPDLLMLKFDMADAEIWEADPGVKGLFKMLTGATMKEGEMGDHAEVAL